MLGSTVRQSIDKKDKVSDKKDKVSRPERAVVREEPVEVRYAVADEAYDGEFLRAECDVARPGAVMDEKRKRPLPSPAPSRSGHRAQALTGTSEKAGHIL